MMPPRRRITPEARLELDRLGVELGVMAEFFDTMISTPDHRLAPIISTSHAAGNLRGLRMLVSEFSGMLSTLDGAQRKSVDTAFRSRTGRTLAAFDARGTARLARILARGVIRGEEQYYFVRESLEVAGLDSARTDEVAKIEALLLDYENKIEKTLAKRRSPPRAD